MAATSVLKLTVDSNEYNASLKDAQRGMSDLERALQDAGKTFADVDKQVVDYVKEIGNMSTSAKNSRGQMREMSQTLTELTLRYRHLTDEERQSPFGEALSQSISQLTERAAEVQDAMGDMNAAIAHAASDTRAFDQAAGAVTVLTSTMQTAQGAAKLLGINLDDNVEVIAKLQAAMSVTSGLQQLQTMLQKQSALMQGINALQAEFNILASANPYMILATAVAAVAAGYLIWKSNANEAKREQQRLGDEIDRTIHEIELLKDNSDFEIQIAEAAGASRKEIFKMRMEAAKAAADLASINYFAVLGLRDKPDNFKDIEKAHFDAQKRINDLLKEDFVNDVRERHKTSTRRNVNSYSGGSAVVREETEEQKIRTRIAKLEQEYQKASLDRREAIQKEIASLEKEAEAIDRLKKMAHGETFTAGELGEVTVTAQAPPLMSMQSQLQAMQDRLDLSKTPEEYQDRLSEIRDMEHRMAVFRGEDKKETKEVKLSDVAGQLTGGINNMVSSMEQLGIDLPEGMQDVIGGIQSVVSILSAISTIVSAIEAISAADTILPFHQGGIVRAASGYRVPGNYGYDAVPALLTSGEVVLNKAQQGNLAASLSGNIGDVNVQPFVDGERIFIGVNNTSKRMGHGEIVTMSTLRRLGLI